MSALAPIELESQSPEIMFRLANSPQWAALTDSQKIWVIQFLATGNALSATRSAYKTKSEANNRVLSYELRKNPTIVAALDAATGKVTPVKSERLRLIEIEQRQRKKLIGTVEKQLKAAKEGSIAASKFSDQLERLKLGIKAGPHVIDAPEAEAPLVQAFPIGSIIVQDGKRYEVKAQEIE